MFLGPEPQIHPLICLLFRLEFRQVEGHMTGRVPQVKGIPFTLCQRSRGQRKGAEFVCYRPIQYDTRHHFLGF